MPRRGFKTEPRIEQRSKSTGVFFYFPPGSGLHILLGHVVFLKMETCKDEREEGVCRVWKEVGGGLTRKKKKKRGGGQAVSRTVTFTRYDVATLTRCPPRRSAKLLSQSAPVSRSQPSAAPALLGRGLVPQPNPSVGRRCHCPTVKRGFEILNTHTQAH